MMKFEVKINEPLPYKSSYSYFDYQKAWWNTLFRKNANNTHTWLFFFENFDIRQVPFLFIRWWEHFGPIVKILHPWVQPSYKIISNQFAPLSNKVQFPQLMLFFIYFEVLWITTWNFDYRKSVDSNTIILIRRFKVKW